MVTTQYKRLKSVVVPLAPPLPTRSLPPTPTPGTPGLPCLVMFYYSYLLVSYLLPYCLISIPIKNSNAAPPKLIAATNAAKTKTKRALSAPFSDIFPLISTLTICPLSLASINTRRSQSFVKLGSLQLKFGWAGVTRSLRELGLITGTQRYKCGHA